MNKSNINPLDLKLISEKLSPLNIQDVPYEIIENKEKSSIKLILPPISDNDYPTVSIVTPTYNRPDFVDLMIRNWNSINYPRHKLEWIILDDSPKDHTYNKLSAKLKGQDNVKIIRNKEKLTIGKKRNILASLAENQYIVHMDDDDFYPTISVAARIRALLNFEQN